MGMLVAMETWMSLPKRNSGLWIVRAGPSSHSIRSAHGKVRRRP
uniref:Alternative protein APEX2 n=1 Tax=Homo sapiens TaxID=9606 RepID=L8E820_HUMAN|nr:alternative protein APEX2 [Homo sapiens]